MYVVIAVLCKFLCGCVTLCKVLFVACGFIRLFGPGLLCRHVVVVVLWFVFFLSLVCEAIGTAATPDLLCQPRVIVKMIVEKQMECRLAGETEVLGENLPQRHFCPPQNPT
jgi:hypothetical protein